MIVMTKHLVLIFGTHFPNLAITCLNLLNYIYLKHSPNIWILYNNIVVSFENVYHTHTPCITTNLMLSVVFSNIWYESSTRIARNYLPREQQGNTRKLYLHVLDTQPTATRVDDIKLYLHKWQNREKWPSRWFHC